MLLITIAIYIKSYIYIVIKTKDNINNNICVKKKLTLLY